MSKATIRTVNVVHELRDGYFHRTAIDKRPVDRAVHVGPLGLVGDEQVDRSHGGPDRAVYVYADEDAAWWAARLDREIPPGLFGENLRTAGLSVTGATSSSRSGASARRARTWPCGWASRGSTWSSCGPDGSGRCAAC
jgi:MOSC domain-containing protein YiiM